MWGFADDGDASDWLESDFPAGMYVEEGGFEREDAGEDETSWSDLMIASKYGKVEQVKSLLAAGASVSEERNRNTALMVAVSNEQEQILELLLQAGARPDVDCGDLPNPLYFCVLMGELNMARLLLQAGAEVNKIHNNRGMTALTVLCSEGPESTAVDMMKLLVAHGADVKKVDSLECTPLHYWAKRRSPPGTEYLLSVGAQINAVDADKMTPLMHSVVANSLENVKCLIAHRANVNAQNTKGSSALMVAKSVPVINELVQAGAKTDLSDRIGSNCLHYAAGNNADHDVILALEKAGADPCQRSYPGQCPSDVADMQGFKACSALLKRLYRCKHRRIDPQGAQQKRASEQLAVRAKGMELYNKANACAHGVEESKECMAVESRAPLR